VDEAKEILRNNPDFDVNWRNKRDLDRAALHVACISGHESIVAILLTHPDIDVNQKDKDECVPFSTACIKGSTSCARLLLKDRRALVNEPEDNGHTPLWSAAYWGYLDVIKWWIASGREMDLGKPGDVEKTDAIGVAKLREKMEVVNLLERFKSDASKIRHAVRLELDWYDEAAAEMFALVVFVSDGLLRIKDTTTPSPAARFFSIVRRRLPLELQMVVCHRVVGSGKEIIRNKESEMAFEWLAKSLLWSKKPLWSSFFTN